MTLPLIIDSFAGGGGASTGIEMALGRSPDIAINHSADALAMHAVNHPGSCISTATSGRAPDRGDEGPAGRALVGLARLQAFLEGERGKAARRNIRDLAWVVVRWRGVQAGRHPARECRGIPHLGADLRGRDGDPAAARPTFQTGCGG